MVACLNTVSAHFPNAKTSASESIIIIRKGQNHTLFSSKLHLLCLSTIIVNLSSYYVIYLINIYFVHSATLYLLSSAVALNPAGPGSIGDLRSTNGSQQYYSPKFNSFFFQILEISILGFDFSKYFRGVSPGPPMAVLPLSTPVEVAPPTFFFCIRSCQCR